MVGTSIPILGRVCLRVWRGDFRCLLDCNLLDNDRVRPILGRKACLGMKIIKYLDTLQCMFHWLWPLLCRLLSAILPAWCAANWPSKITERKKTPGKRGWPCHGLPHVLSTPAARWCMCDVRELWVKLCKVGRNIWMHLFFLLVFFLVMPFCAVPFCSNRTLRDSKRGVSFHWLPILKKEICPDLVVKARSWRNFFLPKRD